MSVIFPASLTRNVIWNFVGQVAPLFAAVFAIPILIKGMGVDRFGLLSLAWMFIGYFSLFDFGLGRALIKLVSEKLGAGHSEEVPELVWTALFLMALLGLPLANYFLPDLMARRVAGLAVTTSMMRFSTWSEM